MSRNLFRIAILIVVCIWICGCATTLPPRKESVREPKVQEEDITGDRTKGSEEGEQTSSPSLAAPPAAPVERLPGTVEQGSKSPRRFIWRDKKGGGERAWEKSPQRDGD
jgi:hypothetical protein